MTVEELEQKLRELSEQNLEANNLIVHYIAEIEDLEFELGQSNRMIDGQQAEIERLKKDQAFDAMLLYSSGLACEQVKAENDELKKQVDKLKDEIERLTEENARLVNEIGGKDGWRDTVKGLTIEKFELQEQVEELMRKIEIYQHSFEYIQGYEDGEKHAKKDTAKEILQELYDQIDENTPKWVEVQIKIIAKRKGIEVWNNG